MGLEESRRITKKRGGRERNALVSLETPPTSLLAEGHVDQVGVLDVILPLELQLVRVQRGEVLLRLLRGRSTQTL